MYTEGDEAPLEECRLKLSMHYYLKTRACTDNLAHHVLHEFESTARDLYLPRSNGRGAHEYDPKKHNLIDGGSKFMITREEAQAKFKEYHDEVYTDGSKTNEMVGAAAVINCNFQNGETTCHQLSKRLADNSTIFAAEATAITLALDYYRHMDPVNHDVVFY